MKLRERPPSLWKQRGYIGIGNRRAVAGRGTWRQRIDELIENADFRSELTHTAIPQRAASGVTATFTRATTKTWSNNDGYLVTGLAGEIGFPGARRVDNLIRLGAAQSSTLAVAANVTMTLPAGAYQFSMGAGTGTATFSGTGGATGTLAASASARTFVAKTISAGTLIVTASVATLVDIQVVSMVAETDQTTEREYVSVGVESAPYYHGSFVDGVKCFPTDLSGNPLTTMERYKPEAAATNVLFKSNTLNNATWTASGTPDATQNATGIDGATSAWTLTDNATGATEGVYQTKTLTAATWTASVFVKKTVGAQASYPVVSVQAPVTGLAQVTVDTTNGVATPWTAYTGWTGVSCTAICENYNAEKWRVKITFTGTAAAWYFALFPAGTTNPTQSTGILDNAAQGSAVFERAQLELGSAATSYIDNTSAVAAVTRNADVLTYSGGDIPNIKSLLCGFRREVGVSNSGYIAALTNGTLNELSASYMNTATQHRFNGIDGGVGQWDTISSNAYTPGANSIVAWSAATNDVKFAKDGVAQTADTGATMSTVTQLEIGCVTGSFQLNGHVGPLVGWTRNLSQSELNAVTA